MFLRNFFRIFYNYYYYYYYYYYISIIIIIIIIIIEGILVSLLKKLKWFVYFLHCRIMSWTPLHDIVLCKEIIFVNPYSAKKKSLFNVVHCGRKLLTTLTAWKILILLLTREQFETILESLFKDLRGKKLRSWKWNNPRAYRARCCSWANYSYGGVSWHWDAGGNWWEQGNARGRQEKGRGYARKGDGNNGKNSKPEIRRRK